MQIKQVTVSPSKASLEPELFIKVIFNFEGVSLIPINFHGYLIGEGKKISPLYLYEWGYGDERHKLVSMEESRQVKKNIEKTFITNLSKTAIEYIDSLRSKNAKGDVHLDLQFKIICLESDFEEQSLDTISGKISHIVRSPNYSLFRSQNFSEKYELHIRASDWLYEFYPHFNLGKFVVVELPITDSLAIDDTNEFAKRLNGAIDGFRDMQKSYSERNWTQVMRDSRPVWELTKNKGEIDKLLMDDDLSRQAVESFNKLMERFFDFGSKFIHKESQQKELMLVNKAPKEDAILIYTMVGSLINLLAQKLKRSS